MSTRLTDQPHRRFNPLMGDWVLVSPHRTQRPWQGQTEAREGNARPAHDPSCYLCPGNARAGGAQNPDYDTTFVFDNDYAALLPDGPDVIEGDDELFRAMSESGRCRVICFSPRHDLSVAGMDADAVTRVIETWQSEYGRFSDDSSINYVQIFENKGEMMGCSNPHPHCQIWASKGIPSIVATESARQQDYYERHGSTLLLDYAEREAGIGDRTIYENAHFIVVVPYWAVWPFEALVLPKRALSSIADFTAEETAAFADAYRTLARTYNKVFDCEFPYTGGIHQAPTDGAAHDAWQLHMHFYPPLLRSASVKKFMVGYEMMAMPQRDLTAETAAKTLREALARVGN